MDRVFLWLVLPSFYERAATYLDVHDKPLLLPPAEPVEVFSYDLDSEADFFTVGDSWGMAESPEAKAFNYLAPLNLGRNGNHPHPIGKLDFVDGPMPGNNYRVVHVEETLTLSFLQQELNRLGEKVKVERAPRSG